MAAKDAIRAYLHEHGPIVREDGTAMTVLVDGTGCTRAATTLALRKLVQAGDVEAIGRGQNNKGGMTHIRLLEAGAAPPPVEDEIADAFAELNPPPAGAGVAALEAKGEGQHPPGWNKDCRFCKEFPNATCALHRPIATSSGQQDDDEPPSRQSVLTPPPRPRAERSRPIPPPPPRPRAVQAVADPEPTDVEPVGLREEFIALQASYATLVDQLGQATATNLKQAERIGQLEARVARLLLEQQRRAG